MLHAAGPVGHSGQTKRHLRSGKRAEDGQIIDVAEMANPKHFTFKGTEARSI